MYLFWAWDYNIFLDGKLDRVLTRIANSLVPQGIGFKSHAILWRRIMKLNVTYAGLSLDIAEIDQATSDEDIRRIADEVVRSDNHWANTNIPNNPFHDYVVDRFVQTNMVYLRPKVPFG